MPIAARCGTIWSSRTYDLPEIATDALVRGLDSPALRVLAGQARWDVQDSSDRFRVVLDELGIELPDADRAQWRLARRIAGEIVTGHIRAACGADELWLAHQKVRDSGDLRIFVVHRRKSGELVEPGRRRLVLPRSD